MTEANHSPIFILSHPRSGSTLLRYIIEAHPDVCCPGELFLGRVCQDLYHAYKFTVGQTVQAPSLKQVRAEVANEVRNVVLRMMNRYCNDKGKSRWCEKSVVNLEHIEVITEVFPDAHFLCLYRNCRDVVESCLTTYRAGYPGRLGEFVRKTPGNIIEALVESWCDGNQKLLAMERAHQACLRITYEELVRSPRAVAERMFSFLDLTWDPQLLDSLFTVAHEFGPGDPNILSSSRIHTESVGKGCAIPLRTLSSETAAQMSSLLQLLGYKE